MTDDQVPPVHECIADPHFRAMVAAMDTGNLAALEPMLDTHPHLLGATATFLEMDFVSGTQPGQYFSEPRLLWFVAENPYRHQTMPENVEAVVELIVRKARLHQVPTLQDDLDVTLSLVTSGDVPQKTGHLESLVKTLVNAGADPNVAEAALAHGQADAVRALLAAGAEMTLAIAAGLGLVDELRAGLIDAEAGDLQVALSIATSNGQPETTRLLLEGGAEVNAFNPENFHAHCTALHNAVGANSAATVQVLLKHGADTKIQDTHWEGDALDWAEHLKHEGVAKLIQSTRE